MNLFKLVFIKFSIFIIYYIIMIVQKWVINSIQENNKMNMFKQKLFLTFCLLPLVFWYYYKVCNNSNKKKTLLNNLIEPSLDQWKKKTQFYIIKKKS